MAAILGERCHYLDSYFRLSFPIRSRDRLSLEFRPGEDDGGTGNDILSGTLCICVFLYTDCCGIYRSIDLHRFYFTAIQKMKHMATLLVGGIMIGYICSAITDFVVTFAEDSDIVNLHGWSQELFRNELE